MAKTVEQLEVELEAAQKQLVELVKGSEDFKEMREVILKLQADMEASKVKETSIETSEPPQSVPKKESLWGWLFD